MIQSHEIITNPECKVSVGCKAHWLVNGSIVVNPLILFIFYCHRERAWVRLEIKCLEIIYIYIYLYIHIWVIECFLLIKSGNKFIGYPVFTRRAKTNDILRSFPQTSPANCRTLQGWDVYLGYDGKLSKSKDQVRCASSLGCTVGGSPHL